MRKAVLLFLLLACWPSEWTWAYPFHPRANWTKHKLDRKLCGTLLDFTHNHHHDNRFWSNALCCKRDMYVYLPPGYDCSRQYPVLIYLHGIAQDEAAFLDIVSWLDRAIACGDLPPMVVAAPDGTTAGNASLFNAGSFYINSPAGRFGDYVACDVMDFVCANFSIRPERNYHIVAGASMGGFGAYNIAIRHRDRFKIVAGIFPALHIRYLDCHGRYFADYDPNCLGIRERVAPLKPIGRFYGVITIRQGQFTHPLYGCSNREAIEALAAENPYEMLDSCCVQPGELDMWVGCGKKDQFNIDAQVEAFVDKARCKGLEITCVCDPRGRHDTATGERLFPDFCRWVTPLLAERTPVSTSNKPRAR